MITNDKELVKNSLNHLSGKYPKFFWFITIVLVLSILGSIFKPGQPSICDCKTVMYYEEGSVQAAKRILNYDAGEKFMSAAQRECGLKYWDEIDKWDKSKGLYGTPRDNAMLFFHEKCK